MRRQGHAIALNSVKCTELVQKSYRSRTVGYRTCTGVQNSYRVQSPPRPAAGAHTRCNTRPVSPICMHKLVNVAVVAVVVAAVAVAVGL